MADRQNIDTQYITIAGGYNPTTVVPIDSRLVLTKQEMKNEKFNDDKQTPIAIPDNYFCLCKTDSKLYIYNKNNAASPETGKFRPLSSASLIAGNGIIIVGDTVSVDTAVIQAKLTAGANITIDANNVISAQAGLPEAEENGTAAIYKNGAWTAQPGYGCTISETRREITWDGTTAGKVSFKFDPEDTVTFYKVSNLTPAFEDLLVNSVVGFKLAGEDTIRHWYDSDSGFIKKGSNCTKINATFGWENEIFVVYQAGQISIDTRTAVVPASGIYFAEDTFENSDYFNYYLAYGQDNLVNKIDTKYLPDSAPTAWQSSGFKNQVFSWNLDTTGKISVSNTYYKVSDTFVSFEQFGECRGSDVFKPALVNRTTSEYFDIGDADVAKITQTEDNNSFAGHWANNNDEIYPVVSIQEAGTYVINEVSYNFPEPGIYFYSSPTYTAAAVMFWVGHTEEGEYLDRVHAPLNAIDIVAGDNISIDYQTGTISATSTTYTAGDNIQINGTTISATDTTYAAGENITIQNNVISAQAGLPTAEENGTALIYSDDQWKKQTGYGYLKLNTTTVSEWDGDLYGFEPIVKKYTVSGDTFTVVRISDTVYTKDELIGKVLNCKVYMKDKTTEEEGEEEYPITLTTELIKEETEDGYLYLKFEEDDDTPYTFIINSDDTFAEKFNLYFPKKGIYFWYQFYEDSEQIWNTRVSSLQGLTFQQTKNTGQPISTKLLPYTTDDSIIIDDTGKLSVNTENWFTELNAGGLSLKANSYVSIVDNNTGWIAFDMDVNYASTPPKATIEAQQDFKIYGKKLIVNGLDYIVDSDTNTQLIAGSHDGTNWTSIKLGNITKNIPTYTAGAGISIENNVITNTINTLIPAQASATNQLGDKAFINSTIQTATANFRGSWDTWSAVPTDATQYPVDYAGSKTPTVNDYLVVIDASGYAGQVLSGTWRFKYSGTWEAQGKSGWLPEYQVNRDPLTAAQIAALNSGITTTLVSTYNAYATTKENKANKVTSISATSTDEEYPSAKCVYTIVGNIEAALDNIIGSEV